MLINIYLTVNNKKGVRGRTTLRDHQSARCPVLQTEDWRRTRLMTSLARLKVGVSGVTSDYLWANENTLRVDDPRGSRLPRQHKTMLIM